MQSFIVVASLVSDLAGGQNDPPLLLNVTKNILQTTTGSAKNDFSRNSDQWRARRKKIFRSGFVVCKQFTFKIRRV